MLTGVTCGRMKGWLVGTASMSGMTIPLRTIAPGESGPRTVLNRPTLNRTTPPIR